MQVEEKQGHPHPQTQTLLQGRHYEVMIQGGDEEVQSTPCSQAEVRKPFPGMMFDTLAAAKLHYNKYAKVVGFSIKTSSSKNSVLDGEKERQLFVCNKNVKNEDINE
jgi:hypothetical protein